VGPDNTNSHLACTPFSSSTSSFGSTLVSGLTDWGYANGSEQWVS
jgi:hypothetical protein